MFFFVTRPLITSGLTRNFLIRTRSTSWFTDLYGIFFIVRACESHIFFYNVRLVRIRKLRARPEVLRAGTTKKIIKKKIRTTLLKPLRNECRQANEPEYYSWGFSGHERGRTSSKMSISANIRPNLTQKDTEMISQVMHKCYQRLFHSIVIDSGHISSQISHSDSRFWLIYFFSSSIYLERS